MSEVTETAPREIYLCVSDEPEDEDKPFDDTYIPNDEGVTWSTEKSCEVTVKYVRADLYDTALQKIKAASNVFLELARVSEEWATRDDARAALRSLNEITYTP